MSEVLLATLLGSSLTLLGILITALINARDEWSSFTRPPKWLTLLRKLELKQDS
jgi:hypothetical protein